MYINTLSGIVGGVLLFTNISGISASSVKVIVLYAPRRDSLRIILFDDNNFIDFNLSSLLDKELLNFCDSNHVLLIFSVSKASNSNSF